MMKALLIIGSTGAEKTETLTLTAILEQEEQE
jgi:hypothetical protein